MDHMSVPEWKRSTDDLKGGLKRRPVQVKVNRIYSNRPHTKSTDINNNQGRLLIHPVNPVIPQIPPMTQSFNIDLPAVSLCFAILQVVLYFSRESLGITSEEVVYVSWKTVVTNGEVWRLFYAHYFHFGRVHIFFNVVTLMGIGRFLEKKIKKTAFALIIIFTSAISNLLYIFLNDILCSGPQNEYTVGFSTAMFSLRMIHIFTMDSEANNGKGDPNLIFGFFPIHLPPFISPWQPVIENIFFDIFIIGRCVAATVSGMCAGLPFPYLMKHYRNYIMIPRNPPPSPPKYQSRQTSSQPPLDNNNNNDVNDFLNDNRPGHLHND